ncbi:MAG: MFS transporter [Hyphomonadaceae bacterium]
MSLQSNAERGGGYRWYVLGVLVCVYMVHHLDRMVIALLQEPIKHEFDLSDSQLALLTGTAFAVAFGIAGLPLGYLADRIHRVRLISGLITVWSVLTALGAASANFTQLLLIRAGIGAAESGSTPTNLSIVSDYFKTKRSTAIGVYMMGPQLGTLVGFAITGIVAATFGWRAALLVAGLPGLLLVLVLLATVREPPRQEEKPPTPSDAYKAIFANKPLVHLIAATTIVNVVAPGFMMWFPSLLIRSGGLEIGSVGLAIAFTAAPVGIISTILAGHMTEKIATDRPERMARYMALFAVLNVPSIMLAVATSNAAWLLVGFAIHLLLHMFMSTPGYAMCLGLVAPTARGTTGALMQVLSNLIGFGLGPMVGGVLSDLLRPQFGADSLRYAMAIYGLLSLWAAYHHLRAGALLARAKKTAAPLPEAAPA